MKPILYIGLAASLALGACSSTYKTAQTPDDVYYSPRQQQRTYASNNGSNGNSKQDENDANYVQGDQEDGGNYVTYQDEDQGDYQRRLNRFGSGGSSYSGDYWDGYNAASSMYMNSYGLGYGGFGMGYSPYSSFYGPSLSLGIGWGMGGFYSPWNTGFYGGWGYPYIGSYWPSYYYPYYGGGYYGGGGYWGHGGGYYGGGYYGRSRPSNSYGPVRGSAERVPRANYTNSGGGSGGGGYTRPNRTGVFQPGNGGNGGTTSPSGDRPRRVFQQSSSERPVTRPTNNYQNSSGDNGGYSRPQRVEYSRPAPSPAPSYTPPSSGGGRVNSGGGGGGGTGGGGYSRPSRGGR